MNFIALHQMARILCAGDAAACRSRAACSPAVLRCGQVCCHTNLAKAYTGRRQLFPATLWRNISCCSDSRRDVPYRLPIHPRHEPVQTCLHLFPTVYVEEQAYQLNTVFVPHKLTNQASSKIGRACRLPYSASQKH